MTERIVTAEAIKAQEKASLARAQMSRFVGCGDPERVLVAGDTHGNTKWVLTLVKLAARHHCAGVLQLGDFGYWSHLPEGERFLGHVDGALEHAGLWLLAIPGNHENHTLLRRHRVQKDGFWWLRDHIAMAPFGARWEWQGVRFGALGGAWSIDKDIRVPMIEWWPGEEPTGADAARLGDEPLDILVSHDVPLGGEPELTDNLRGYAAWRAVATRRLLLDVVQRLRPRLVLHGHWHVRHSRLLAWADAAASEAGGEMVWGEAQIEGLASDSAADERSWGVLHLGEGQFVFAPARRTWRPAT